MVFYIFVAVMVVLLGWALMRSRVMRSWLSGRSSDPFASGSSRDHLSNRGFEPSWNDDGGTGRRGSRLE